MREREKLKFRKRLFFLSTGHFYYLQNDLFTTFKLPVRKVSIVGDESLSTMIYKNNAE